MGGEEGVQEGCCMGGTPPRPGGGVHRGEEERHEPRLGREATMACPLEASRWPEPTQAKNGGRRQRTIHRNANRRTSASGCTGDGLSPWNGARRHEGARPPRKRETRYPLKKKRKPVRKQSKHKQRQTTSVHRVYDWKSPAMCFSPKQGHLHRLHGHRSPGR